tara:strand:+ start:671 stop:2110 length:1440 start_codon:yes stop_codon:yes gene_type:complete
LKKIIKQKNLFSNKFYALVVGTLGSYILPILLSPILTRIYTPNEFSLYTFYITIVQVISIASTLKYDLGIPLAKDSSDRINLFRISFINTILISVFFFSLTYFYTLFFKNDTLEIIKFYIPMGIILQSLFSHILYNWLLSKSKFNFISIGKIIFGFTYASLPIILFFLFGLKDFSYIIIGHQLGLLFASLVMLYNLYHASIFSKIIFLFRVNFSDLYDILKKYKKYAIFSSPSHLINTIGMWLPVIFIWSFFEEKYASLFFLSHRAINLPVLLLGHSIGKIFFSEALDSMNQGILNKSISQYFKILLHIAIPFLLVCIFLSPEIFSFIFSEKWSQAGDIVRILSPWIFITFIAAPLSTIPTIFYRQEVELKFHSILLIFRIISLSAGVLLNNLFLALIFYSFINTVIWFFYLVYMLKISNVKFKLLFNQPLSNKIEYFSLFLIISSIHIFLTNPIYVFISIVPVLMYVLYSFLMEVKKI